MKNESDDFMEYAKALAKAERALGIEHWVIVTIERRTEGLQPSRLFQYDLSREMLEKYRWVIRWRTARFQCQYPRDMIVVTYCFYDKRTKLRTDFNSCLSRLAASKAQITVAKKRERQYIERQKLLNPLFYDEAADPEVELFRKKLHEKQHRFLCALLRLRQAVRKHKTQIQNDSLHSAKP